MALSLPQSLSLFNNAVRPRGAYLSGPGKVFAVWTVREYGGIRFAAKQHDGAVGTEFLMPVAPDNVFDFDVAALTGDRMAVVYTDGLYVKFFVYDFVAGSLITDTTILTTGNDPSMVNDGRLRTTYLKNNIVKMITELAGSPLDLVESPTYVLREHNVGQKQAYVIKYLAAHSQSVDVALPIRAGGTSVLVHDYRDTPLALPAFENQSAGLKAYYKLDDNAPSSTVLEATGLGVGNGTLVENGVGPKNTEDVTVPGFKVGPGFGLNGSSYYVSVPSSPLMEPAYISVFGWVNINSHQNYAPIISKPYRDSGWTNPYFAWSLRSQDTSQKPVFYVCVGGTYYGIEADTVLAPGTTYLVGGTYDGSRLRVYVNNNLAGERSDFAGPIDYGGFNTIASMGVRSVYSFGEWLNGTIDDIRVYDYGAQQAVVDEIWNGGAGAAAPPPYPDGLWDYYFADKSGNGNVMKFLESDIQHHPGVGLKFGRDSYAGIYEWDVPASFVTLEALFVPSGQESSGRMLDGQLFMGYDAWNRAYFGYVDGGTVHKYLQTRLTGLTRRRLNHVAVTHQWGVAASTKLYVNGLLVPGEWVDGTGATDPALGTITSTVAMGRDDYMVQLAVDSVAKSQATIEGYAKGRL